MKIVVLDGFALNPGDLSWSSLENIGETIIYDRTRKEDIIKRVGDAEIIFTNKTLLLRDTLEQLPKVKYIGVLATGYNVVDIQAAKELGITVTNIPDYGTKMVAQYVFSLLLEICNHVGKHNEEVKKGEWFKSKDFCFWKYPLVELTEKKIGIIGMGRIGQEVTKIAQAFGMKVLAYSTRPNKANASETLEYVDLDSLFARADIISLHCPLTEVTKGLINKISVEKMKDGVMIINTARGPLIVEDDLAEALKTGKVAAAAVDVLSTEPPKEDNPLIHTPNCIVTPHIAWASKEARERLMSIAVNNLINFLQGHPVNVI